jgi:hypothetical protein
LALGGAAARARTAFVRAGVAWTSAGCMATTVARVLNALVPRAGFTTANLGRDPGHGHARAPRRAWRARPPARAPVYQRRALIPASTANAYPICSSVSPTHLHAAFRPRRRRRAHAGVAVRDGARRTPTRDPGSSPDAHPARSSAWALKNFKHQPQSRCRCLQCMTCLKST